MVSYRLASDVFACATDDCVVFLALARNKYHLLELGQSEKLIGHVQGWEALGGVPQDRLRPAPTKLLRGMISAGLLTMGATDGRDPTPPSILRPETTLVDLDLDERPRVRRGDVFRVVGACLIAYVLLRTQRFASVVNRVKRRRKKHADDYLDIDRMRARSAAFFHLQPLCFGARRNCVLYALALLEFLAMEGLYPPWIFGIETGPFTAHCWVQEGSVVVNDSPDHVRRYTPILVA